MDKSATTRREKNGCLAVCAGSRLLPGASLCQSSPITLLRPQLTKLTGKKFRKKKIIFVPTVFGYHAHTTVGASAAGVKVRMRSTRLRRRHTAFVMRKREVLRALHQELHRAQHWQYRALHRELHRCHYGLLPVATSAKTGCCTKSSACRRR